LIKSYAGHNVAFFTWFWVDIKPNLSDLNNYINLNQFEMKKKKLKLDQLKVKSFDTSLSSIKGGLQSANPGDTDGECCRDLTIPDSVCNLCGPGPLKSINSPCSAAGCNTAGGNPC